MEKPTLLRPVTTCRYTHRPTGDTRPVVVRSPDDSPDLHRMTERCADCGTWALARSEAPYFWSN